MKRQECPFVVIPLVRVHPDMITVYNTIFWTDPSRRRSRNFVNPYLYCYTADAPEPEAPRLPDKPTYSGLISPHAKKRLKRSLNLLVAQSTPKEAKHFKSGRTFWFNVNFVTLTLPCAQRSVTDKQLKKQCLDPFLKTMRRKFQLKSYVWRAERQYNGNLHIHLTTDTYLPFDQITACWNNQLSKFHFIDEFYANHGHRSPNSTDVHSVQKIANIAAYMVKYMSKDAETHLAEHNAKRQKKGLALINPDNHPYRLIHGQPCWNDPISGKIWDCSQNLKTKDSCTVMLDSVVSAELSDLCESPQVDVITQDNFTVIFFKKHTAHTLLSGYLLSEYLSYISRVQNSS